LKEKFLSVSAWNADYSVTTPIVGSSRIALPWIYFTGRKIEFCGHFSSDQLRKCARSEIQTCLTETCFSDIALIAVIFYIESGVLIEKRMAIELVEKIPRFRFREIFTSVLVISWRSFTYCSPICAYFLVCLCFKPHGSDPCNPGARFSIFITCLPPNSPTTPTWCQVLY